MKAVAFEGTGDIAMGAPGMVQGTPNQVSEPFGFDR